MHIRYLRIYPFAKCRRCVLVAVTPTRKEMLALTQKRGYENHRRSMADAIALAITEGPASFKDGKRTSVIGEVFFSEENLGPNEVSHEMLHIALGLVTPRCIALIAKHRKDMFRKSFSNRAEENLCNLVGTLVERFWKQWEGK